MAKRDVAAEDVRAFILDRYAEKFAAACQGLESLPDEYDLLTQGIIDSLDILELVSSLESHFEINIDLGMMDAESITRIGPLARYIASQALEQSPLQP